MPGQNLFSDTMFAYQKVMDFRTQRHNLVSSNLTNAETPAYKAKDVEFESILNDAISTEKGPQLPLAKTNSGHIGGASQLELLTTKPEIVNVKSAIQNFDGNTVSVESEMSKLNKNSMLYQTETEVLSRLFGGLKYAVTGGGR
jgi:flagellar basal-body rod protein FlgB